MPGSEVVDDGEVGRVGPDRHLHLILGVLAAAGALGHEDPVGDGRGCAGGDQLGEPVVGGVERVEDELRV